MLREWRGVLRGWRGVLSLIEWRCVLRVEGCA